MRRVLAGFRRLLGIDEPIPPGVVLGENVFIGGRVWLDPSHGHHIVIEDDAVLSGGVRILTHDASSRRRAGFTWVAPVRIGRGAFVGADALVLPGVTVGEWSVVGAGSVVTGDVAPRAVVVGNPAREIGTVDELDDRRRMRIADGTPLLDEAVYHVHPLSDQVIAELQALATQKGGYFLGPASSKEPAERDA